MTQQIELPIARSHQWKPKGKHPYWEERSCAVCGLEDQRTRNPESGQRTHNYDWWRVTTPCIEPVPKEVTYEALIKELKPHGIRYNVVCVGVPGAWRIGFSIGDGNHTYPFRREPFKTVERGFAELLRWIRARQYRPERYSDIDYQHNLNRRHSCACCDDDD